MLGSQYNTNIAFRNLLDGYYQREKCRFNQLKMIFQHSFSLHFWKIYISYFEIENILKEVEEQQFIVKYRTDFLPKNFLIRLPFDDSLQWKVFECNKNKKIPDNEKY